MARGGCRWDPGLLPGLVLVLGLAQATIAAPVPDPEFEALLEFLGEAPGGGEAWDELLDSLPAEAEPAAPPAPETDISQ
jgi:hypothetical protein